MSVNQLGVFRQLKRQRAILINAPELEIRNFKNPKSNLVIWETSLAVMCIFQDMAETLFLLVTSPWD